MHFLLARPAAVRSEHSRELIVHLQLACQVDYRVVRLVAASFHGFKASSRQRIAAFELLVYEPILRD